ncbi:MAG: alpha/beta hydrolase [Chthoniobacterales bacterium]|nr:alpha/beta hydrolase [Chthoniobacterales bacterium]
MRLWKKKPALGIGIGVGVMGALALAFRYGVKRAARQPIPDAISPAIFATRVARTSFGEMIYHVSGSGAPLVFLHGVFLGASSYEWSRVYPRFVMDHEVIVPDIIGFGESERPPTQMDAGDYVTAIAEFLQEVCGGEKPVVIASGLTAGLSLLLAARHPELLSQLIVFLPTGLKEAGKWRAMGILALSGIPGLRQFVYRNYLARPPFIRAWLTRFALTNPESLTEEMVSILSTCAMQYGAEHAILGFLRGRLAFPIDQRLRDVPVPVHILWPDQAVGFSPEGGASLCRKLPRGSLEVLPGCGILAALENPDVLESAIVRFLQGDLSATS